MFESKICISMLMTLTIISLIFSEANLKLLQDYIKFIINNLQFLCFGFLMTLGSSFGQTYFIALFSAEVRNEFALTHGDYGILYSIATLFSSITLIWLGRKIDQIDLRWFCFLAISGLAIAAIIMATAKTILLLTLALYALRLTGQGLMWHAAATSMARYFHINRGLALSISSAGLPAGEAFLPFLTVSLLTIITWRQTWLLIAILIGVGLVPLIQLLLKSHKKRHENFLKLTSKKLKENKPMRQWSRYEVIRDPQFYNICLITLAPAFIITGLFFHQVHLTELKGWSLSWFAICFSAFAFCRFTASISIGPLIDRKSAKKLLPWYLLPLIIGMMILSVSEHRSTALIFMMLAGLSTGSGGNISTALWAEIYGTVHIGGIRSLSSAVMVFSSALSPAIFGWLIDNNVTIDSIIFVMAVYSSAVSIMAYFRFSKYQE